MHHKCSSMEDNIRQKSVSYSRIGIPLRIQSNKHNSDLTTAWINLKNILFSERSPVCMWKNAPTVWFYWEEVQERSRQMHSVLRYRIFGNWGWSIFLGWWKYFTSCSGACPHLWVPVHEAADLSCVHSTICTLRCHYFVRWAVKLEPAKMNLCKHKSHSRW